MRVRVGTSGFQYEFWRGSFYPEKCSTKSMLSEFAQRLDTVEINATFYRMPKKEVLERWVTLVPEDFRFAIKASRRITHDKRLKEVDELVEYLCATVRSLGSRFGMLLFQLPPNFKQNLERLDALLAKLPEDLPAAIEFRHASWLDETTFARLREHDVTLVASDEGEGEAAVPLIPTASRAYMRLRRESYQDAELTQAAAELASGPFREAYVFFKHEEGAPARALALREVFRGLPGCEVAAPAG